MTAVFHANGKDVWLVGHEWNNNSFSFLPDYRKWD